MESVLGLPAEKTVKVSAKTGFGIQNLLDAICERLPPPRADRRLLVFRQRCVFCNDNNYDDDDDDDDDDNNKNIFFGGGD